MSNQIKKAFYYDPEVAEYLEGYRKRTGVCASHVMNQLATILVAMSIEEQLRFSSTGILPERMCK